MMPKREPGPTDPMMLTGVELPATEEDVIEMARSFAEEFAMCGWTEDRLLHVFKNPRYGGPHLAWRQLGEERVREVIEEALQPWRNAHA